MKKLQKVALVAFFGFLAVSFSSCTKDLEDRVDKVEKDVAKLITDVNTLSTQLGELSKKPGISISSNQDPTTGKITFTTKNPDYTFAWDGKDGKGSVVTILKATPDKDHTTIKIEGDANSPYVFLTNVTIPNNVSSIEVVSKLLVDVYESRSFTVNVFVNTTDGSKIKDLNAANFTVIEPKTKAATSEIMNATGFEVVGVERVADTNEFQLTLKSGSRVHTDSPRAATKELLVYQHENILRFQLNDPKMTVSAPFEVDVYNVPDVDDLMYGVGKTPFNVATISNNLGEAVVFTVDGVAKDVVTKLPLSFKFDQWDDMEQFTPETLFEKFTPAVYEINPEKYAEAMKFLNDNREHGKQTGLNKAELEGLMTTLSEGLKGMVTSRNDLVTTEIVNGEYFLNLKATEAAKTIADTDTRTFIVSYIAKTFSANGEYVLASGLYQVTKRIGITMPDVAITTVAANEASANGKYSFTAKYRAKTYRTLVGGVASPQDAKSAVVDVRDANGAIITMASDRLNPATNLSTDENGYLDYTVNNLDVAKLPTGVYSVDLTIEYVTGKFITFTQKVTITRPVPTYALSESIADRGIIRTGNDLVINSIDPVNASTSGTTKVTDVRQVTTNIYGITTVTGFVANTNYKVFYRLHDGDKYIDGQTAASAYTYGDTQINEYTAVEKTLDTPNKSAAKILMDKKYSIDVVVVFQSGIRVVKENAATYTYVTTPITHFMDVAGPSANVTDNLARGYVYGTDIATAPAAVKNMYDFSYINDKPKYFFLGNAAKATAIWYTSEEVPHQAYNRSLSTMTYEIMPLPASEQAKIVKTDGTATTGNTTLVQFGGNTNSKDLVITSATLRADATLEWVSLKDGATKFTAPVVQTIKISGTDAWGRKFDKLVVMTINTPAI